MKPACIHFKRDGFCAKGQYCEFSHAKVALTPCKNYLQSGSCKFGDSCVFAHHKPVATVRQTAVLKPQPAVKPVIVPISKKVTQSVNSVWGFTDEEPVYFYGASGTFNNNNDPVENCSYAKAACLSGVEVHDSTDSNGYVLTPKPRPPCRFFSCGNCKFGNTCRYSHDTPNVSTDIATSIAVSLSENIEDQQSLALECGICMGHPVPPELYGLMSHCNCVFCLNCIREWRREGIAVTHDTNQLRRCPLCRTDSFFIIPSTKPMQGTRKQQAIDAYQQSMKLIPCKNYSSGGCSFGTSCFYKHVNSNGEEETYPLQRVFATACTVEMRNGPTLSDFVLHKLSSSSSTAQP